MAKGEGDLMSTVQLKEDAGMKVEDSSIRPIAVARQGVLRITCFEAECSGCKSVHRQVFGPPRFYVEGEPASEAAYLEACERVSEVSDGID